MSNKKLKPRRPAPPAREAPAVVRPDETSAGRVYFKVGAALSFLVSFVTYVATMAPSAPFWDAGEFIASSYILGIPHSPGTPLYVLVGRVFTLLPLPFSIAGKVNFISVLFGAGGVLVVYLLVVRFLDYVLGPSTRPAETLTKAAGGLVAALFIAFSDTYWANTTEAEVYAMSTFFLGFMTWLGLKWADNPAGERSAIILYLLFYLLGLLVGLHLGTILAFTGIFFLVIMTKQKSFTNAEFLLACAGMAIFVADATLYRWGDLSALLTVLFFLAAAAVYVRGKSTLPIFLGVCLLGLVVLASTDFGKDVLSTSQNAGGQFVGDGGFIVKGVFIVLLAVGTLAVLIFSSPPRSTFAVACTGLFVLGISAHLYLLIRSGHNPAIDEGYPETWRALYAVLRREQYPPTDIFERKASWAFQFQFFNGYFQSQFQMASAYLGKLNLGSVIPIALGIWGMVDHYARHRRTFVMLFSTFLVMSLGMIVYLNFSDAEVRERDYFYLPAFYYFAVFIGIGAGGLINEARKLLRRRMAGIAPVIVPSVVFLIMPLFTLMNHYFQHDRSRDYVCREYAKNMLVGLEENAILFTNGDNDTFPLWYIQEVEKYRTDVRVVNLSLLNTAWYIKQLRDNEPKVDIRWTNPELAKLTPVRTKEGGWLLVRDIGVQHILRHNSGKRPVYFAVTIPPQIYEPYRDFLEMEGLAYKVVPRRGTNMVNMERLHDNIWNKYSYLTLLDENMKADNSVYQPLYVRRLVQNYAAAFAQEGFLLGREDKFCEAVESLEVAREIAPDMDVIVSWLGWYYLECGDSARAVEYYENEIKARPERSDLVYRLAGVYERLGEMRRAIEMLDRLVRMDPNHRDGLASLVSILMRFNQTEQAKRYLEMWVAAHPEDRAMRQALNELKGQPPQETPADGGERK